ncbi:MAG TPA: peptide chain release factor N(5)-glutamine methyltransferase [Hyphomicrobiales bacterium]|nr:peptide chain release factor N(5)-glutamine methyltransferase [Hyphomicrobiales bacterium]
MGHASAALPEQDTAVLEAQLLLCEALAVSRSHLYAYPERLLNAAELARFEALCVRRAGGEPIAYILGRREFWNQTLAVAPGVLIPRPETELLVELALALGQDLNGPVVDLGTGSGAIALALAAARPDWTVIAIEREAAARELAARNFQQAALRNLSLRAGSWYAPLNERDCALLVANPPYLAADDPHLQQGDLRFEPASALVAAEAGLADLRHLAQHAPDYLRPGGWLLLEHGWQQGAAVREALTAAGLTQVQTRVDTAGRDRVTLGCRECG